VGRSVKRVIKKKGKKHPPSHPKCGTGVCGVGAHPTRWLKMGIRGGGSLPPIRSQTQLGSNV